MKTSTKVAIGASVVAVATIATGAVIASNLFEKMGHAKKRRQVKGFVHEKLGSNGKLLAIVDKLSDVDIDHIIGAADKVKDSKERISVYGDNLKETTHDLKNRLTGFIEDVM